MPVIFNVQDKGGQVYNVKSFGAVGDGVTDDSSAINSAIAAASTTGMDVYLPPATYGCNNLIDGTRTKIRLFGVPGQTILKRLTGLSGNGQILSVDSGPYTQYSFEGITFNGNQAAVISANNSAAATLNLGGADRIRFSRCDFRETTAATGGRGMRNIEFRECNFWGTTSGVMQSGVVDPSGVLTASLLSGCSVSGASAHIILESCYFHFNKTAFLAASSTTQQSNGITIRNCRFRSDWWCQPYIVKRLTIDSYNNTTKILTTNAGGLTGLISSGSTIAIPIQITSGSSITATFTNRIDLPSNAFSSARIGDVIETDDGKRAEILSVETSTRAWINGGWESIDTFEPTTPPSLTTGWRIRRYYSAAVTTLTDTTATFYSEPINVFTGERLVTDAGLSPVGITCRLHPVINYGGVESNGGVYNLAVINCTFRGSWADQCSMFDSYGSRIIGNRFEYGQDEGITITRTPYSVVMGNTFRGCGTSAIFCGSDNTVITGNSVNGWAYVNRAVLAAFEISGKYNSVGNNSVTYDTTTGFGGGSSYAISLRSTDCSGTIISGTTGITRTGIVYADTGAALTLGAVTAYNVGTVGGPTAANVATTFGYNVGVSSNGNLILTAQSTPSSLIDGEIFQSSQKILSCQLNNITHRFQGTLYSQTASGTVTNTTTETTLVNTSGAVGTLTLPANFFIVGKTVIIEAYGVYSSLSASPGTLHFRVYLGSTVVANSSGLTMSNGVSNQTWSMRFVITCRSTGTSGTIQAQGQAIVNSNGVAGSILSLPNSGTTINTTSSFTINITNQFSVADPANTMSCTNLTVSVQN